MHIAFLTTFRKALLGRLCLLVLSISLFTSPAFALQESPPEEQSAAKSSQQSQEAATTSQDDDATQKKLASIEAAIEELTKQVKQLQQSQTPSRPAQRPNRPADESSRDEPGQTSAASPGMKIPAEWLKDVEWRELGPSNMAGRVTDIEVHPQDLSLWWIGTASGGLLKTNNQGTTVEHQFDRQETISIGAIAADPTNKDVLWVGTGEANPRNSVSYGNGVYKSTDGGKSFEHMGLEESYQISRILVDPTNPDTVYVGAAGRLYGTNKERGVYKTTDGGKTWNHVLAVDDRAGVIDMIMHPADSQTMIVALWDRMRDGFDAWPGDVPRPDGIDGYDPIRKWGPGGGLYKTSDGGKTWKKLSQGLPPGMTGRIGLDWQSKSPHTIFAIIDCEDIGKGPDPFSSYLGIVGTNRDGQAVVTQVLPDSPAAKAEVQIGDVLKTLEGNDVQDFDELLDVLRSKRPEDTLTFQIARGDETLDREVKLTARPGSRNSNDAVMGINGEDGEEGGALLTEVTDDGPSDKAGLVNGDVVTKVGGQKVDNYEALVNEIRSRSAGDEMKVTVKRNAQELEFTIRLGSRSGGATGDRPYTYSYFGQRPNSQDQQGADGYKYGGVYKSTDAGESWERVNSLNVRPMYFSEIRVDPSDEQRVYVLGVSQFKSENGGVTFTSNFGRGVHADAHDLWINPNDGRHMIIGCDGGFYVSHDRGDNWDHINTAAIGQFYDVTISNHQPFWVFGGLQDNGSWGGPGISKHGGAINSDWISIGGGDGFVCRTDRDDPDLVYSESQNGSIGRRNLRTGERARIRPEREEGLTYRFNWKTPFELSHHNAKIFYTAGNYVWRSLDRGDNLQRISPEITLTQRGSATAFAESPRDSNVLYVGTDDGALWVTRNGGDDWKNITRNLRLDRPMWVSTIEASRFDTGRVYVCIDGHRSDSDAAHIFVSNDYGETFISLGDDLPRGSSRTLREDPINENLLYLGTEWAFWVSLDRGQHWTKFNQKLPTVAVHEVAVHPELPEIVLATHGRSLWACDVHALRQLGTEGEKAKHRLLDPTDVIRWRREPSRGGTNRQFVGTNPSRSSSIWYTLQSDVESVMIRIDNIEGESIAEIEGPKKAGLQNVQWNLSGRRDERGRFQPLADGTYRVTLVVNGEDQPGAQTITLSPDPTLDEDAIDDVEFQRLEMEFPDVEEEEEERDAIQ